MDRGQLDPESDQIREVFSRFGLALFQAQALERQLAIILASKYGPGPTHMTRAEFDDVLSRLFSMTLGSLVNEIAELSDITEDEEERLKNALSKRNWLAHRYFWERAIEFISESGRASMIKELQGAADSFQALDELFTQRSREWGETIGITQQSLDKELERLIRGREDS